MNGDLHIGRVIKKIMEKEGRKVEWLAKNINCHRNNIYKIYQQESIHLDLLIRISISLRYNFFSLYYNFVEEHIHN